MRHPRRRDRFRSFIAAQRLAGLLACYVALTLAVAALLGLAWWGTAGAGGGDPFGDHALPVFLGLYGMSEPLLAGAAAPRWLALAIALLGMLLPTLLLGAVVFKVLAPPGRLLVFRPKLELVTKEGGCHLVALFYISSRVPLRLLELTAVVRTYEAAREDGRHGDYPMKTFAAPTAWSRFHLPFAETASTTFVPVRMVAADGPPGGADEICLTRGADGEVRVHSAGGIRLDPARGDFVHLFLIAQAKVPSLQSEHSEIHRFSLPRDIAEDLPSIPTPFDPERYRFETPPHAWARFDG